MNRDWMTRAACAESELDFYDFTNDLTHTGTGAEGIDPMRFGPLVTICATKCSVQVECASYAMRLGAVEQHGCWAGTTGQQRMRLRLADNPIQAVIDKATENLEKYEKALAEPQQISFDEPEEMSA